MRGRDVASRRPAAGSVGLGARPVAADPRVQHAGDHRLFIAVRVPDEVSAAATRLVETARHAIAHRDARAVRWVTEDAHHLTIRFLGATPPARVDAAAQAVAEAARASHPFSIAIGRSGAFPRPSAPRTLWLGVEDGADDLSGLAARVERALVDRGWPAEDRPFRAHLTLGRCEDPAVGAEAAAALAAATARFRASWRVGTLVLYESHLGRGPARYAVVAEHRLGA